MHESKPITRVRIRGVYSTALTKLLLENGFQIVQASRIIAERLGIPQLALPADVTIKTDRDSDEITIIGYSMHVDRVRSVLQESIRYSAYLRSKLPLHATVVAKIVGRTNRGECRARVGDVEAILEGVTECKSGETITAFVRRTGLREGELVRLVPGVEIIGDYAIVSKPAMTNAHGKVTISEHIRSAQKRAELLSLSAEYTAKGYSIHWRSSASIADANTLSQHLRELVERLKDIEEKGHDTSEVVLTTGEDIVVVIPSSIDKKVLDDIRAKVVPTAPFHHMLKSSGLEELTAIADFADKIIEKAPHMKPIIAKAITSYIAWRLRERSRLPIYHVTLGGKIIRLGEAEVQAVEQEEENLTLLLKRVVKTPGVYNGLNINKEPGDYIITTVSTNKWYLIHQYYSSEGELKGTYININTPPEITTGYIKYIDLEIDIIKKPDERPKLIDMDKLINAIKTGVIGINIIKEISKAISEVSPQLLEEFKREITSIDDKLLEAGD
ncbi:MAG: DUF402 domain-containing protein [Pyrodictiaceae archaeon]